MQYLDLTLLRKKVTFQNLITLLVFLFPIGAVIVRHWVSGFFTLLCLLATGYLIAQRRRATDGLQVYESRLLWILLAYFLVFLLTAFINDPVLNRTTPHKWRMAIELRFLFAIPLYLMIRKIPSVAKALLWGCAVGVAVTTGQAIYETQYLGLSYANGGIYGRLFTGPITLLMGLLLVPGALVMTKSITARILLWAIALGGLYVVVVAEARVAYVAMLLVPLIMILYTTKGWKRITVIILTLIAATTLFTTSSHISSRFSIAGKEIKRYFADENKAGLKGLGSADFRLEELRALKYFAKDHALLGVGTGNYPKAMQDYVDHGLVNPQLEGGKYPHNAFANAFVLRGIFGLIATLLLIFYPLYMFIRVKGKDKHTTIFGIIHLTSMFIFALNESAPFNKGNFVAVLLLFLSCFYSWHLQNTAPENHLKNV